MQLREHSAAEKSHAPAHTVMDHPTSSLPLDERVESPRHAASHASTLASRTEMLLEQVLTLLRAIQVVDAAAHANAQPPVPSHAPSVPPPGPSSSPPTHLTPLQDHASSLSGAPVGREVRAETAARATSGSSSSATRSATVPVGPAVAPSASTAPALLQQPLVVSPHSLQRASVLIDPNSATGHIVEPPGQAASPLPQDDAGLPLTSTRARARQEALDAADAAATEADIIRIQDKMDKLKPEQRDSIIRLPLGPDPDEFARFASSCKGVVTEILNKSDVKRKQTFNSSTWVTGWLPLLRKRVRAAVVEGQTTNRATLEFLDATFLQVENHLRKEPAGPSTYAFFIQKLAAAWDTQDKSSGIDRLRSFGVSNGETYGEYIRRYKALAMTVMVSHHAFKPSDAQVQIAVRDSMLKQFPLSVWAGVQG
ncbi:unnamed protein product [Ectocarpus sp. CCAP 1310/34]|nr:unnamed protein product [Ectocarpus sp. CCAP 1310/34]